MTDRISSGIQQLDDHIEGGIPVGSVISFFGKTTTTRKYVTFKFIEQIGDNESLFINTRDPISTILMEANRMGINTDNVQFLDAVHWRSKRINPKSETQASYEVSNLTDLNALLAKIMEACKSKPITRIMFDSPSSLLLYTTPGKEQVYKFFELLAAFVRNTGITFGFTIEEGVHDQSIVNTIHYLSDGVIVFNSTKSNNNDNHNNHSLYIDQMILTDFDSSEFTIETYPKIDNQKV